MMSSRSYTSSKCLTLVYLVLLLSASFSICNGFLHRAQPASSFLLRTPSIPLNKRFQQEESSSSIPSLKSRSTPPAKSTTRLWAVQSDDDDEWSIDNRIRGCIPYLLPLLDMDRWGKYFYERLPVFGTLHETFFSPLVQFYESIPFGGLLFFLLLTFPNIINKNPAPNARFNGLQASFLDITLIVPDVFTWFASDDPTLAMPRSIVEPCYNMVFYVYMTAIWYCIIMNLRGKMPNNIPYVSAWAEHAMMVL